jgi:ATP-binding cassette subfamily C (CFTR/MRP) protein 1
MNLIRAGIAQAKDGILISIMVAYRWSLFRAILPRLFLIGFKYSQPFLIDALISLISKDRTQMSINKGRGLIAAYILVYAGIAVSHRLMYSTSSVGIDSTACR